MASYTPGSSEVTGPRRAQLPVGLRILSLWGTPVRRWMESRNRTSAYLFSVASSVILIFAIYCIGAILAYHYGVLSQFLASPLVPGLLAATAWSAAWIAWAVAVYLRLGYGDPSDPEEPEDVRMPRLTDEQRRILQPHWDRVCSVRVALQWAWPAVAIVVFYVYLSIYPPHAFHAFTAPASVTAIYAYPDQTYWMFAYLAAVAAILADVASFGLFFTVEHLRFVSEFVRSELTEIGRESSTTVQQVYRGQKPLQGFARITFVSSMGWFGAIAIFVGTAFVELSIGTVILSIALVVLGLYVFLRPQWEFHELIHQAKQRALAELNVALGTWYDPAQHQPKPDKVTTLLLAQNVAAMDDWHVDVRLVVAQLVAAAIPIAIAFVHLPQI